MKTIVTKTMFIDWFKQYRPNNFTYKGLDQLFDWLEQYEDDTEEELEFDPIAICCDFTEYSNMEEFWNDYNDKEQYPDIEAIEEYTLVIPVDKERFIIQNF